MARSGNPLTNNEYLFRTYALSYNLFEDVVFNLMLSIDKIHKFQISPATLARLAMRAARIDMVRLAINTSGNDEWFLGPDELHNLINIYNDCDPFIHNVTLNIPPYFSKLTARLNNAYEDRL